MLFRSAAARVPAGPASALSVDAVTDQAVARLNIFTYVGAVLGGALTGVFATAGALRTGFVVLAVLALVSAVLAGRFREAVVPDTSVPEATTPDTTTPDTALPTAPAADGTTRP